MRFHCLAIVAPEWLLAHSQPEWVDRYEVRLEDSRLPSGEEARQVWVQSVGQDGATLLGALFEPEAPSWLAEVPAVDILRRVWLQNYQWSEGKLGWRSSENIPPASLSISSPYDLDAHYSKKRTTSWVGWKRPSNGNLRQRQPASDHPCRNDHGPCLRRCKNRQHP